MLISSFAICWCLLIFDCCPLIPVIIGLAQKTKFWANNHPFEQKKYKWATL